MRALLLFAFVAAGAALAVCEPWKTKAGLLDINGAAVTDPFAIAITNYHNFYRCEVYSAYPARATGTILEAKWSPAIAASAQNYVNQCYWGHNVPNVPYGVSTTGWGENLYMGISTAAYARNAAIAQAAVANWASERPKWSEALNPAYSPTYSCLPASPASMACGHFTQMVWTTGAKVRQVGCGFKNCAPMKNYAAGAPFTQYGYVGCRYAPPGNVLVTTRGVLAAGAAEVEGEVMHAGGTIEYHHHDNSLVGVVAVLAVVAVVAVVVAVATVIRSRRTGVATAVDSTELLA